MTITTNVPRNEYTATGGQTVFNYTFRVFASTDLHVYRTVAGDEESLNDLISAYTVAGVGSPTGGSITLNTGATAGDKITIVSAIPASRTTNYQINGDFIPLTVNEDFDRVVSLVKQSASTAERTLRFNEAVQGAESVTMAAPSANKYFRWDGTGAAIEFVTGDPFDVPIEELYERVWAFDTVADLVAETTLEIGMSVKTHGYSAAGDSNACHYKIVAGGTGTHDGINYIDLSGSGLQALRTVLTSIPNTYTTAGTQPNFTVTTSPAYGAYASNQLISATFHSAGTTGSNTLNRDSLGAKNLKQYDSTGAKVPAVIASGMRTLVIYDGTDQVVLNPLTPTITIPPNIVEGTIEDTSTGATYYDLAIPANVKRINLHLVGVSTSGSDPLLVQLGDSGGLENTGYTNTCGYTGTASGAFSYTSYFVICYSQDPTMVTNGMCTLSLADEANNVWVCSGTMEVQGSGTYVNIFAGSKSLSSEITTIRFTTTGSTDTFDAGTISLTFEYAD